MNPIKKIVFLVLTFLVINSKAQVPCNQSNSPIFQVTINQATLATSGVCGMHVNIVNANTNPPGGAVNFCFSPPGQSTCAPPAQLNPITQAGIWTLTVKDLSNNCMTSQTVQVTILSAPAISLAASNTLFCSGQPSTLTASGANTYTWNTNAKTASISLAPVITSTYSVLGTGLNGCTNTASTIVNVNPLPNLTVTANQNSLCVNESLTLTASGANTYTWNTTVTGGQYTTSPFTTTGNATYTIQLEGTNNAGCIATKNISGSILVQSCETVGIKEYTSSEQIKLYPVPANDFIELEISDKNLKNLTITVYTSFGQLIHEQEILFTEGKVSIHTNDLGNGIYSLQIKSAGNKSITKSFVILR